MGIFIKLDMMPYTCQNCILTDKFNFIQNKVLARNKAKLKVYLSDEEKKVLAGLLDEWNSKPNKNTCDSFVSS